MLFNHLRLLHAKALDFLKALRPLLLGSGLLFILSFASHAQTQSDTSAVGVQRIISLSPGTTELIASAGGLDKLVGVVAFSDYPLAAKSLPLVGSSNGINIEKILQLQPDLIVTWQGGNRLKDLETLQHFSNKLGFKILTLNADSLKEIPNTIKTLEQLIHPKGYAKSQVNTLQKQLAQQAQRYQNSTSISAFYQIWQSPLMTIGGEQFISQALRVCGAQNIFSDVKTPALEVSVESVLLRNPQVIFLGGEQAFQNSWHQQWQAWSQISAVKNQQIYFLEADAMQRPTARLIEYLPTLCRLIDEVRTASKTP